MKTYTITQDNKILKVFQSSLSFEDLMGVLLSEIHLDLNIEDRNPFLPTIELNDLSSCIVERVNDNNLIIRGNEDLVYLEVSSVELGVV